MSAAWATDNALQDLRRWWYEGVLVADIARDLGTTSSAINGMVHRLSLPARELKAQADWMTDAALRSLREWWPDASISTAEIGRRLHTSKNAIVGKARRLGLDARPSPIRRDPGHQPAPISESARQRTIPRATLLPLASESPAVPQMAHRPPPPVAREQPLHDAPRPAITAPAPKPPPTPMAWTNGRSRCWPIGMPKTPVFRFCDDRAVLGRSYCAEHCKLAFVRVKDREPASDDAFTRMPWRSP